MTAATKTLKVAIADDHFFFRKGLGKMIEIYQGQAADFSYSIEAASGQELLESLEQLPAPEKPDIALIDLHMPGMDGFETMQRLHQLYPDIRILVLSVRDDEDAIIRCFRLGACGFLTKDIETEQLKEAIDASLAKGYYYSEKVTRRIVNSVITDPESPPEVTASSVSFTKRELEFIRLACSDLTYSQISEKMYLSPRTVDGYRNTLFAKLHVGSRVGLALWAVRNGIVPL